MVCLKLGPPFRPMVEPHVPHVQTARNWREIHLFRSAKPTIKSVTAEYHL